jgi:trigger factor
MEKVYHDNGNGTLNVSLSYEPNDYQPIVVKVMDRLCEKVTVKGFRTGKAPKEIAMRYVRNEDIYDGMVNKLIDKDFPSLLDKYEDLRGVADVKPELNVTYDEKKKVYNFLYTFVLLPKAEVKKYTGFDIKVETKKVADADVDKEINRLLTDQAELVPSQEGAANGDHVLIDFTGYVDGKEFDGGSAKDYDLTLGSKAFVPGFEDALVGAKEGDKKSIDLTFPKDYLASLANKPAKFSVTVKGVKKVVLPKADDEFAKTLQDYKVQSLEELKKAIQVKLTKQNEDNARNEKLTKVMAAIQKDAKVVVADKYVELSAAQVQDNQVGQFKQMGLTLDEYLKIAGVTLEQFKENAKKIAKDEAEKYAIVHAIAKDAKLEASEDDLANRFGGKEKFADLMKVAKEQAQKNPNFSVDAYLDSVRDQILNGKVNDFLVSNN